MEKKELSPLARQLLGGSGAVKFYTQQEFDESLAIAKAEIMAVAVQTTKHAIAIENEACAELADNCVDIEKLGEASLLYLEISPGAPTITLKLEGTTQIRSGENIRIHVAAQDLHLFDTAGDALSRTVDLPV